MHSPPSANQSGMRHHEHEAASPLSLVLFPIVRRFACVSGCQTWGPFCDAGHIQGGELCNATSRPAHRSCVQRLHRRCPARLTTRLILHGYAHIPGHPPQQLQCQIFCGALCASYLAPYFGLFIVVAGAPVGYVYSAPRGPQHPLHPTGPHLVQLLDSPPLVQFTLGFKFSSARHSVPRRVGNRSTAPPRV